MRFGYLYLKSEILISNLKFLQFAGFFRPEYPRRAVSNAFGRRGYPVHKTKASYLRHAKGIAREGLTPREPEPFHDKVEA